MRDVVTASINPYYPSHHSSPTTLRWDDDDNDDDDDDHHHINNHNQSMMLQEENQLLKRQVCLLLEQRQEHTYIEKDSKTVPSQLQTVLPNKNKHQRPSRSWQKKNHLRLQFCVVASLLLASVVVVLIVWTVWPLANHQTTLRNKRTLANVVDRIGKTWWGAVSPPSVKQTHPKKRFLQKFINIKHDTLAVWLKKPKKSQA
jgi:hypothetical protein